MKFIQLIAIIGLVLGLNENTLSEVGRSKVRTNITMRVGDGCFDETHLHIQPDNNPQIVNLQELEKLITINETDFDLYDRDDFVITYSYIVHADQQGNVESIDLSAASNLWSKDHVESAARQLKFQVALKDGKPIDCVYFVWFNFRRE
ncbi:energy transducer TonB [Winogradskyella aurantiaca]|uniref:hypothetical protein n=1 Tax=Winogradskyella aurantiaca TaxID=2219558 RepID=UPI000E1C672C|nr:hypothetical protein [Winogradskyella aurantiaca]